LGCESRHESCNERRGEARHGGRSATTARAAVHRPWAGHRRWPGHRPCRFTPSWPRRPTRSDPAQRQSAVAAELLAASSIRRRRRTIATSQPETPVPPAEPTRRRQRVFARRGEAQRGEARFRARRREAWDELQGESRRKSGKSRGRSGEGVGGTAEESPKGPSALPTRRALYRGNGVTEGGLRPLSPV
jgi:hypothetical protein